MDGWLLVVEENRTFYRLQMETYPITKRQVCCSCLVCNFLTSNITFLYKKVGYPIKHERELAEEGFSILLVLLLGINESF